MICYLQFFRTSKFIRAKDGLNQSNYESYSCYPDIHLITPGQEYLIGITGSCDIRKKIILYEDDEEPDLLYHEHRESIHQEQIILQA